MSPLLERQIVVDCRVGTASRATLAEDVRAGLTRPLKELPPKYFYDERGSGLFERICELPEYYPTQAERAILERHAADIAATAGAAELVELGAGYATKTRVLLDAMNVAAGLERYLPVDVSGATVRDCATRLAGEYPGIGIHGLVGDFERDLVHLPAPRAPRLVAFLGGTLGNFRPAARAGLLRSLRALLDGDGWALLGSDLVKSPALLERAYNDDAGVTADFNRNVLRVINRELDGDFVPERFEHVAFYEPRLQWIEMRLRADRPMRARIRALELELDFAAGEEIRTEISAKFTRAGLDAELAAAGFAPVAHYTDPDGLYNLSLACAR